jgi:Zn-dependent metalloprotease
MRQLLLYGFCLFFSTFLTAQKKNSQNLENNLKSNSKVESFFMNKDRQTPSMIKMNPDANLTIENVPGFLTSALQIKNSAFQFTLSDRLMSKNGSETVTFSATYNGVNLIHAKYKAFVKDSEVKFISMEHYSFDKQMNKSAGLTKNQARGFATKYVDADIYVWETISNLLSKTVNKKEVSRLEAIYKDVYPSGELVYVDDYSTTKVDLKLAYRFNMYASEPVYRADVFIDAQSGKTLLEDAIIKHANKINEDRAAAGITAGTTYGPQSATVATGKTRYAGIRNFETTETTVTDDLGNETVAFSLEGTIDLSPYGIVDDPLTTEVNEALVLNETRSLDGVGGAPVGVNGIPSYSIYDGFTRAEENPKLVSEVGDNNWTAAEHYQNDFSTLDYPADNETNNDDIALDAHWGAEIVIRYWAEIHGRSSHDNKGAKIINYVHSGDAYDNAFWNGTAMTYGDGSYQGGTNPGGSFAPLTSLDVCGHEIGHGVCNATSDLVYAKESGAMNEGFSDIWAAAVEDYVLRDIDASLPYDPWGIGEQIDERDGGVAPGEEGSQALRWMDDPDAAGDPSYYDGDNWVPVEGPNCLSPNTGNDNCGVHSNSGVLNKWYYLLVAGSGKELTLGVGGRRAKIAKDPSKALTGDGRDYFVDGLGFVIADQITFKAEVMLTSNAKFAEMREASILVAQAEYGSFEVEQVTNAWYAVGVGEKYITPAPGVLIYQSSNPSLTSENSEIEGCDAINTITLKIAANVIETEVTIAFTFDESTATLGEDFDVFPTTLTFPVSEDELIQEVTVTIYNDALIEDSEIIQMNFANGSEATDIRKQTITIIDNDYSPISIGNGSFELLNETFDTGFDAPTAWFVDSEFDVNSWYFNGSGSASGRAYVSKNVLFGTEEPSYDGTANSSIHLLTSPIDARGVANVNVSFDWTAGGENDGTTLFDWGEFMYTFDGVLFESVERFTNGGYPGGGVGPQANGVFDMAIPALDGKKFKLIWRWYNDALVQSAYSFSIDNVLVTGDSQPVESNLTHSDSENIKAGKQVHFISDQDVEVIAIIENATADLGCVTLEVAETGFGGVFPNTIDGAISHAGKVIKITADGENAADATYDVTLYYTDSELSNIQDPNSLKMMKVNSSDIDDASDNPSANYTVSGVLVDENTDRSYRSYKGTFTGNGVIGLVSTTETLAATSFNVSQFNVFPTLINNSESVNITNSKTFIEKVDIYSINGKLVKSFDFNSKYNVSIPVTKLSSGMYFLNINKDRSNTHKFIVK